jgi:AcrR family transcriptional regulator
LYHHFQDFAELLELAQVRRFSNYVNKSIEMLTDLFNSINSRVELLARLRQVSETFQARELADTRIERITAISKVRHNPRMAAALGIEQERLTESIADLFHDLQLRNLGNPALAPRTAAVLFQAYTLGRTVDDFTVSRMDQENWLYAVSLIVEHIFFPLN